MRLPALLTLLLLPGCGLLDRAAAPPAPDPVVVERAWVRDDVTPASSPLLVEGTLVLYEARAGELFLTGVDPATGRSRWSVPASDGSSTPGVDLFVVASGRTLVHLRPGGGPGLAAATATDATTGERIWADTRVLRYVEMPLLCGEDSEVCASAERDGRPVDVRLRVADGRYRETPQAMTRATILGRSIGAGVRDTGEREPDVLAGVDDDGRVLWRREADELFGLPVTSDAGFNLRDYDGVVAGDLGRVAALRARQEADGPVLLDVATSFAMAAFEHATGRALWDDAGAVHRCGGGLDAVLDHDGTPPFRCRSTGQVVLPPRDAVGDTGPVALGDGVHSVVEGFDPRTGRTTWSADVGTLPVLGLRLRDELPPMGLDGDRVVLSDVREGRHLLLDLGNGSTEEVDGATRGWCVEAGRGVVLTDNARIGTGYRAVPASAVPCRADREPVELPQTLEGRHGTLVGDVLVWSTPEGLYAARQTSGPRPSPRPSATGQAGHEQH